VPPGYRNSSPEVAATAAAFRRFRRADGNSNPFSGTVHSPCSSASRHVSIFDQFHREASRTLSGRSSPASCRLQSPPSALPGHEPRCRSNGRFRLAVLVLVVATPSSRSHWNAIGLRLQCASPANPRRKPNWVSLSPLLYFAPLDLDLVVHNRPLNWTGTAWSEPSRSHKI
jgi:hypothetical protein